LKENKEKNLKRLFLIYGLLIAAAVFSFLFALNIRVLALMMYRTYSTDPLLLAGSMINATVIILVMVLWIIYFFYLQHRLEKKCTEFKQYRDTFLIFILPAPALYLVSEVIIRWVAAG
jgi:hypothetical protein